MNTSLQGLFGGGGQSVLLDLLALGTSLMCAVNAFNWVHEELSNSDGAF